MQHIDLGKAIIRPKRPVVAGSFTTITFTYVSGHPIDDTGFIKIVFRSIGDFGMPQFDRPTASNYCTVHTTGDCRIEPRWDNKGHMRPWGRSLFLQVMGGFLDQGREIIVVFGDTSEGSPGWQMQTFCEETFEFKTLVDPIAAYEFKELLESPTLRVVPGKPARAVCIAPSQVVVNEEFTYHLRLEDEWGNPTDRPREMTHRGFSRAEVQSVKARDKDTGLSARSNPINVLTEGAPLHPYWADFHGQSEENVGSNVEDYFTFARDYGLVDISAHQANDFLVTDEFWKIINNVTERFYEPGVFVTFPGYEWSGNTSLGGDRNIYFTSEGGELFHSYTDLPPGKDSTYGNAFTATDLFENLRRREGPRVFAFAHVGGRYADMNVHDPELELAVEVHSGWGTFEWLVEDALRQGYRVGINANSDGHRCRPGAGYPGASEDGGSFGGLTCVLAHRLDRSNIFQALKARHFYGTTGNRCLVDVRLVTDDGRSAIMGDVIHAGTGTLCLYVSVIGTAPIESVEVRNGLEMVKTLRPYGEEDLGNRVKIVWSGAEVRGRDRMVAWDGCLRVQGNTILGVTPINFWNAYQPLETVARNQLAWKSITMGGVAGMIVTLDKSDAGSLKIETLERNVECAINSIGLQPKVWQCGGLQKKIKVYRLPDQQCSCEISFSLPLTELHKGDNPIYIRMAQEDGHMAWTSPVYLVRHACG
jgi:hypothetical protein